MTNEQALNTLYAATRRAPLSADDHDIIRKAAEQLVEALKSLPEGKAEEPAKTP